MAAKKGRKRIRRGTVRWTSPEAELRVTLVGEDGTSEHPRRSVLVPNGEPHSLDLGDAPPGDPAARRAWLLARLEKIEWALVCNSMLSNAPNAPEAESLDLQLARVLRGARLAAEHGALGSLKEASDSLLAAAREEDLIKPRSERARADVLVSLAHRARVRAASHEQLAEFVASLAIPWFADRPHTKLAQLAAVGLAMKAKGRNGGDLDETREMVRAAMRVLGFPAAWVKTTFDPSKSLTDAKRPPRRKRPAN